MSLGKWAACGMTGVVIVGSLAGYGVYQDVFAIDTAEINTDGWGDRPAQVDGLHNILLLGTDERAGEDASYNELNGVRPDVLVVVSIDVDQGGVTMVNLPRDTMVEIPPCEANESGDGWAGGVDQINHAMTYGGMDCQGNTVETVTGIHLDHMVLVDFAGFENIVDSIGGIEMCVPEPIDDPKAHLVLDAGTQRLDGEQALGLARSRDSTESRSDLDRIENQHRMIGAILREVTSGEILSSPSSLYGFLDSVTDSLVTDENLTNDKMTELAVAMREVDLGRMNMVTAPVVDYAANPNKVALEEGPAQELFAAVAAGELTTGPADDEESGAEDDGGPEPSEVSLRVLNNTGINGRGSQVQELLVAEGFVVTESTNPDVRAPDTTTVYHGPDRAEHAEVLASALSVAEVVEEPSLGDELELVMGGVDWDGLATGGAESGGGSGAPLGDVDTTSAAEDEVTCS
ncbi:LCP family protein [Nocardiopsis sp. NPDC006938]|uniref:LCP family protein n=1 Tax=Nocardiopsis sp. NPDC006938 TaxID=3364337 RepID=UPI0036BA9938